jgi:RNA polymerase sigma-70 factor (sigma-E family)
VGRQSDEEFRGWAQTNRPRLRQAAFLLCGDWFLADDLVQDCLIRIFDAWPRIGGGSDLTRYSRRVLVNLYLDHRRRPSRRERPSDSLPDVPASLPDDGPGFRAQLVQALRCVPPGQRAVLVLRFFDDLSVEQTADALGTSAGNVKSQTSRGLTTLRHALVQQGLGDAFDLQEQP